MGRDVASGGVGRSRHKSNLGRTDERRLNTWDVGSWQILLQNSLMARANGDSLF
jgi:hypothetical protein